LALYLIIKNDLSKHKWFLIIAVISIPLAYVASQAGWIVSEVGRQPWVVQDLMPTMSAVTRISSGSVQLTFWLFAILFTVLLIAEIKIMLKQIKTGPKQK
jgi:cytochrome d ubiquinol oxidase subunit I